jgi:hypothetical protein
MRLGGRAPAPPLKDVAILDGALRASRYQEEGEMGGDIGPEENPFKIWKVICFK